MFDLTTVSGPQTTQVSCALLETMASEITALTASVARIEAKLDELLSAETAPRVEFIFGPVREQE